MADALMKNGVKSGRLNIRGMGEINLKVTTADTSPKRATAASKSSSNL